jgi:hypothetical protein
VFLILTPWPGSASEPYRPSDRLLMSSILFLLMSFLKVAKCWNKEIIILKWTLVLVVCDVLVCYDVQSIYFLGACVKKFCNILCTRWRKIVQLKSRLIFKMELDVWRYSGINVSPYAASIELAMYNVWSVMFVTLWLCNAYQSTEKQQVQYISCLHRKYLTPLIGDCCNLM